MFACISVGQPGSAPACYGNLDGVDYKNQYEGRCIYNETYCFRPRAGINQCAILEAELDAKCGAWDECAGAVCRPIYLHNGEQYCLARKVWDDTRVSTMSSEQWSYKKIG